jgi:hypothetical protein
MRPPLVCELRGERIVAAAPSHQEVKDDIFNTIIPYLEWEEGTDLPEFTPAEIIFLGEIARALESIAEFVRSMALDLSAHPVVENIYHEEVQF